MNNNRPNASAGSSNFTSQPSRLARVENRAIRNRSPYLNGPSYGSDTARGILRRREIGNSIIDSADGFPYYRRLKGHKSCVNALTFSRAEGRWLASGGDDFSILLWDFHQEDVKTPSHSMNGPTGNVFCLEFSASNSFLYVGGTDRKLFKYDIEHLSSVISTTAVHHTASSIFMDHENTIRAISCHPIHDDIFLSASEDGSLICHDTRQPSTPTRAKSSIQMNIELSGVQYHPTMDNLFVSSNTKGQVYLHDARMAFDNGDRTRGQKGIVKKYTHIIEKRQSNMSNPEASSLTFDKDGSKLAVTYLNFLPVIYSVSDPHPIAVLSGRNYPDGTPVPLTERSYYNSCTMKHGSFGGSNITTCDMYAAGSDDFRNYIWKIPPVQWLLDRRHQYSAHQWELEASGRTVAFTEGYAEDKYVPYEVATPFCRLTGYKSIVNTSVFHPHQLHVASSGVEKDVFLHSPTPSSPCTHDLQRAPTQVRQILDEELDRDRENYITALLGGEALYSSNGIDDTEESEERRALSLFDFIIREEGNVDVFATRRWSELDDDSSDEEMSRDGDSEVNDSEDTEEDDDLLSYPVAFRRSG